MCRTGVRWWLPLLVLTVLLGACSAPPTVEPEANAEATEGEGGEPKSGDDAQPAREALQAVYDELEGLEGEARTERLLALAQEEGGEVSFYGSTNYDDVTPIIEAFEDEYDVGVSHYRAGSSTVMQRILQESDAGFAGADVVQVNGTELQVLDNTSLLLPLETPLREDILEVGRFDNWLAVYVNSFIVGWNSNEVSEEERPKTYEELLQYDKPMAIDVDDFDWFQTVTTRYFIEELGWTEEETVEAFKELMARGKVQALNGHSLGAELLGAGEYTLHASMYHHHLPRLDGTGATWEPPLEPVVVRPNGIGIIASAQHPAAALLFAEFMLSEGQKMLASVHRTPASTKVEGGLPEGIKTVGVDLQELQDNRDHWEGLWEDIVQGAGEVRED